MSKLNTLILSLSAVLFAGSALAVERGDIERGEDLSLACLACHSADAVNNNPEWPRLHGQHADYLLHSLRAYKRGDRENAIMQQQVDHLSDQDLRDLAAYFSQREGQLHSDHRVRR